MNTISTDGERFAALPAPDRRLLVVMSAASLLALALALGILGGVLTALARGGLIDIVPNTGYRFLTVHGVSIFFYWLFAGLAALLARGVQTRDADGGRGPSAPGR